MRVGLRAIDAGRGESSRECDGDGSGGAAEQLWRPAEGDRRTGTSDTTSSADGSETEDDGTELPRDVWGRWGAG